MNFYIYDVMELEVNYMSDLMFRDIDLRRITNRNEKRVVIAMKELLEETDDWTPEALDVQDIYALSLNRLSPRYVQEGTIVFNEPIKKEEIESVVKEAIAIVKRSPNY
jgi:hypothetical protein